MKSNDHCPALRIRERDQCASQILGGYAARLAVEPLVLRSAEQAPETVPGEEDSSSLREVIDMKLLSTI